MTKNKKQNRDNIHTHIKLTKTKQEIKNRSIYSKLIKTIKTYVRCCMTYTKNTIIVAGKLQQNITCVQKFNTTQVTMYN